MVTTRKPQKLHPTVLVLVTDQLWETTMEPASRTLLQVSIDDAAEAERTVSNLMGDAVEPRKEFIQKHAKDVRFLDI